MWIFNKSKQIFKQSYNWIYFSIFPKIKLSLTDLETNQVILKDKQYRKLDLEPTEDLIQYKYLKNADFHSDTSIDHPYIQLNQIFKHKITQSVHKNNLSEKNILSQIKQIPIVSEFTPSVWNHVNLCGGLLTKLTKRNIFNISNNYNPKNINCDIDLFITGFENNDDLISFIQTMHSQYFKDNQNVCKIIKTANAITYYYSVKIPNSDKSINISFQLILRSYSNLSQILHGFDLGSCSIGYNGQHIYLTSLGFNSFLYKVNLIDGTHRSKTYEKRLIKYLKRGFRIVLSEYNQPFQQVLDFKYIRFETNMFINDYKYNVFPNQITIKSDQHIQKICKNELINLISMSDYNLALKIIRDEIDDVVLCVSRSYENSKQLDFEIPEYINNQLFHQIQSMIKDMLHFVINKKQLTNEILEIFDPAIISLFVKYIHKNILIDDQLIIRIYKQTLFNIHQKIIQYNIKYENILKINMNNTSPMTQTTNLLTNSFNPELISNYDWYF
jgi:hypothetical protein